MKQLRGAIVLLAFGLGCATLVACTAGPPAPSPAEAVASGPTPASLGGRPVLFARNDDLWRARPDGTGQEHLSQGRALKWLSGLDWSWAVLYRSPYVSPDGRWIAWTDRWDLVVVDVAHGLQAHTDEAGNVVYLDWAPDSHAVAYATATGSGLQDSDIYLDNPNQKTVEHLLSLKGEVAGVKHLVWSPDSQFIAFSCCIRRVQAPTGEKNLATVQKLEVASRRLESMGEMELYVAKSSRLCWAASGAIMASPQQPAPGQTAHCSPGPDDAPRILPDGLRRLELGRLDASGTRNGTRLTIYPMGKSSSRAVPYAQRVDAAGNLLWPRGDG